MQLKRESSQGEKEELVESRLRLERLELLLCELLHENECLRMALRTDGDEGAYADSISVHRNSLHNRAAQC
jgi:hypothetical protein